MNPYTVDWLPTAEDELAAIWLAASDRPAVTAAQNTVDRLLSHDPMGCGAPIAEALRKLIVVPLMVYYSVQEAQKLVEVSNVYRYPP
jgi:hypothetical protein